MPTEPKRLVKVVLTGGPGAGKSVAAERVSRSLVAEAVHVPEAATQVYRRLGKKWDQLDMAQRRDAQTAMYRLQLEQEAFAEQDAREKGLRVLLLDRGTLDGAGYWPDGIDAFWGAMGTTHERELARYHGVVWLESAAALDLYDHDASNEVRFESPAEAIKSGERMMSLWGAHPKLLRVHARREFEDKLREVLKAVREIVEYHRA
jgi:predicted ATPase